MLLTSFMLGDVGEDINRQGKAILYSSIFKQVNSYSKMIKNDIDRVSRDRTASGLKLTFETFLFVPA